MKIFNTHQIKEWDSYTIQQEPIQSIGLMERAAKACFKKIISFGQIKNRYVVLCGKGNNGGDGLAIARMLIESEHETSVYILETSNHPSADFAQNLDRLKQKTKAIFIIKDKKDFPLLQTNEVLIDALVGSGLKMQPEGLLLELIHHINQSGCKTISIDIPSGMFMDELSNIKSCINATYTLTFQCMKKSLLLSQHLHAVGNVAILDIGLSKEYYHQTDTIFSYTDNNIIKNLYRPRNSSGHKGTYGHALLIAGSFGKMGAASLCTTAALRAGAGLATAHVPTYGVNIIQTVIPEAMVRSDCNEQFITNLPDQLEIFDAIGIGPGIGTNQQTIATLHALLQKIKCTLVLDADALNCIGLEKKLLDDLPENCILTPHPKEFDRLFGPSTDELNRIERALEFAKRYQIIIVLKGHHTLIALPNGKGIFNSTGNAGMATAGSGDVLTGILAGLLANKYSPEQATVLGVYLHGLAGDIAAQVHSLESMIAGDITLQLGKAFNTIGLY